MPAVETHPTIAGLCRAMEGGDVAAAVGLFSPDAVLHSPFTDGLVFRGSGQITAVLEAVVSVLGGLHYTDTLVGDGTGQLVGAARVGDLDIEFSDHLRFDGQGRIDEMTVFFRPLPASAAALQAIGSALGRRRNRQYGRLIAGLTGPLALLARRGDGVGVRLVRSAV